MKLTKLTLLTVLAILAAGSSGAEGPRAIRVSGGEFLPLYGPGGSKLPVRVAPFRLDRTPVTRAEYAEFLRERVEWQPGRVLATFAESGYLEGWKALRPPKGTAQFPVVHVSYFAAAAYCEWKKGRLPTVLEWEFVAQSSDDAEAERNLRWISHPSGPRPVGQGIPNRLGLHDLHGVIWEWTLDYNSNFVTSDNRQDGEMTKNFFCGGGAITATDRMNYPAFIRYAMRGGLRPEFTLANLGFRCAYDTP